MFLEHEYKLGLALLSFKMLCVQVIYVFFLIFMITIKYAGQVLVQTMLPTRKHISDINFLLSNFVCYL